MKARTWTYETGSRQQGQPRWRLPLSWLPAARPATASRRSSSPGWPKAGRPTWRSSSTGPAAVVCDRHFIGPAVFIGRAKGHQRQAALVPGPGGSRAPAAAPPQRSAAPDYRLTGRDSAPGSICQKAQWFPYQNIATVIYCAAVSTLPLLPALPAGVAAGEGHEPLGQGAVQERSCAGPMAVEAGP